MPNNETPDINTVRTILESGKFESFLGLREGNYFEAKPSHPYGLREDDEDNSNGAVKLMIKIAGFANAEGGYIICGLREPESAPAGDEPRSSLEQQGLVASLDLMLEADAFTSNDIKGRVKSSIFPRRLGDLIQVKWWHSAHDNQLGLCSVFVPKQNDADKYYALKVNRSVGELPATLYGVPIRRNDQTAWYDIRDEFKLRRQIGLSELRTELLERLQEIESNLLSQFGSTPSRAVRHLDEVIQEVSSD